MNWFKRNKKSELDKQLEDLKLNFVKSRTDLYKIIRKNNLQHDNIKSYHVTLQTLKDFIIKNKDKLIVTNPRIDNVLMDIETQIKWCINQYLIYNKIIDLGKLNKK